MITKLMNIYRTAPKHLSSPRFRLIEIEQLLLCCSSLIRLSIVSLSTAHAFRYKHKHLSINHTMRLFEYNERRCSLIRENICKSKKSAACVQK